MQPLSREAFQYLQLYMHLLFSSIVFLGLFPKWKDTKWQKTCVHTGLVIMFFSKLFLTHLSDGDFCSFEYWLTDSSWLLHLISKVVQNATLFFLFCLPSFLSHLKLACPKSMKCVLSFISQLLFIQLFLTLLKCCFLLFYSGIIFLWFSFSFSNILP